MDAKKIVIANKNANYEFIVTFNHLKNGYKQTVIFLSI